MAEIREEPVYNQGELSQKFVQFVMVQAQNILFVLGKIPTPDGRRHAPNLDAGKMLIDQLEVIKIKTKGNLNKKESDILNEALSSVQLAFVEASGGTPASMMPDRDPGFDMPAMDEEDEADDSPAHEASAKPAASAPKAAPAPDPGPKEAPMTPNIEDEHKKKYFKSYG